MHVHILGICGTFMAGIAQIAKALGHHVTGSDLNVYPPMSTQLKEAGIEVMQGYSPNNLNRTPDIIIVGNVISRGNPELEHILNNQLPYTNGPNWLYQNILHKRWVIAVSGTHGKTTTSSMVTWILEHAGLNPGFLIGGVPQNFGVSARVGDSPFFVIEADEYDTCFNDKRSKFVHYHPRTVIVNNLEYDHADIFPNLKAIQDQFHQLMRIVPANGQIITPDNYPAIDNMLQMGCWTPVIHTQSPKGFEGRWRTPEGESLTSFEVLYQNQVMGIVNWHLIGEHNLQNALAAIAACVHAGVDVKLCIEALCLFSNVARRMQFKGTFQGISLYDDFAHHPTAIQMTLEGFRRLIGKKRLIALVDLASNSMKLNTHQFTLGKSLHEADVIYIRKSDKMQWQPESLISELGTKLKVMSDIDDIILDLKKNLIDGDQILSMSNGSFSGINDKLMLELKKRESA